MSSVKPEMRCSMPSGSFWYLVLPAPAAPHSSPSTMIGMATEDRIPNLLLISAAPPVNPPMSSSRTGARVCRTSVNTSVEVAVSPSAGATGCVVQTATRVAVPSGS